MPLLIGELQGNGEGRSDSEGTFELTDVKPNRFSLGHREFDLVARKVTTVERNASSVAQTHLRWEEGGGGGRGREGAWEGGRVLEKKKKVRPLGTYYS